MKINRRDYLKQMGAAGMLAGVTGVDGLAHEIEHPQPFSTVNQSTRSTTPRVWQPSWDNDFPSPSYVKLIFYGLIGIAPRRLASNKVQCDVGFHRKGGSSIKHHLRVRACDRNSKRDSETRIEKLKLCVDDPYYDQTYFYQRGTAYTRRQLKDDNDFRWIVDFESDYLYKSSLTKKKSVYGPVLKIENGIFYTLHKTASTFVARSDDNKYFCDMANIADYIAVNVYVKSGGVELKINDDITFPVDAGGEIYFSNHCMNEDTNDKCKFYPHQDEKEKRSDFFLNYKAFDRKGLPEYHMHLLERHEATRPDIECLKEKFAKMKPEEIMEEITSSDESPCSAAGYGGEGGLPAYP